ncbi:hypothetical protein CB1_001326013 [Camelus ferus]|nr:hypothetical protein CB1_001326013 [Camelus ferus]
MYKGRLLSLGMKGRARGTPPEVAEAQAISPNLGTLKMQESQVLSVPPNQRITLTEQRRRYGFADRYAPVPKSPEEYCTYMVCNAAGSSLSRNCSLDCNEENDADDEGEIWYNPIPEDDDFGISSALSFGEVDSAVLKFPAVSVRVVSGGDLVKAKQHAEDLLGSSERGGDVQTTQPHEVTPVDPIHPTELVHQHTQRHGHKTQEAIMVDESPMLRSPLAVILPSGNTTTAARRNVISRYHLDTSVSSQHSYQKITSYISGLMSVHFYGAEDLKPPRIDSRDVFCAIQVDSWENSLHGLDANREPEIFGVDIRKVVEKENTGLMVPLLIQKCIMEIEKRGCQVVGLYRLCGSAAVKKELREAFERDSKAVGLCENQYPDINVITGDWSSCGEDYFLNAKENLNDVDYDDVPSEDRENGENCSKMCEPGIMIEQPTPMSKECTFQTYLTMQTIESTVDQKVNLKDLQESIDTLIGNLERELNKNKLNMSV